jgi:hypothetical protein
MATPTNTAAPAQPAQQIPTAPFRRVSEMLGEVYAEECVVFLRSFGPWNAGVSAGFAAPRAQWLYKHRIARPYDPRTDRVGVAALVRK